VSGPCSLIVRETDGTLAPVIRSLSQPYTCKGGAPVIDRVDTAIFFRTYFMDCMKCSYCHDSCCQYGADVEGDAMPRVMAHADALERYTGVTRDRWWRTAGTAAAPGTPGRLEVPGISGTAVAPAADGTAGAAGADGVDWTPDREFPGGRQTRTRVEDGACVFRSRTARGCMLHSFALGVGLDYHEIKPMVCSLFPVTFDGGLLHPSNEIIDRSLQCIDDGPSLYQGVRDEIAFYFGAGLVAELDVLATAGADAAGAD
jgi:Fe-S-cluster containining protein